MATRSRPGDRATARSRRAQLNRRARQDHLLDRADPVVVVFTLVFIGPLYWLVTDGLKSTQEAVQTPPTLVPAARAPEQLHRTRGTGSASAGCCSTPLYYAFGALAFQLVFDVAAAYALSKLRPVLGNVDPRR